MHREFAEAILNKHEELLANPEKRKRCFIGFDGVTDEIIDAIAIKKNKDNAIPFKKIEDLGKRIVEAAGKSCNIELAVRLIKIGGNAPILTEALLKGEHLITFTGTIGEKDNVENLFLEIADACEEVFPLGPSAHSDAIEFEDGKVILGKLEHLKEVTAENLLAIIGKDKLKEILEKSDLFISANWTMLTEMNAIWEMIIHSFFPLSKKKRWHFIDLADPAKRTDDDLKKALQLLQLMNQTYDVILGLNEAEAKRIAHVLGIAVNLEKKDHFIDLASAIKTKSGLSHVVIHATRFACASSPNGNWLVDGPYTDTPFMTTGAGDNFNAGFCNAILYGFTTEQALLSGVATSGYYVRKGKSPTMKELAAFLESGF